MARYGIRVVWFGRRTGRIMKICGDSSTKVPMGSQMANPTGSENLLYCTVPIQGNGIEK